MQYSEQPLPPRLPQPPDGFIYLGSGNRLDYPGCSVEAAEAYRAAREANKTRTSPDLVRYSEGRWKTACGCSLTYWHLAIREGSPLAVLNGIARNLVTATEHEF